jgi:hypothetical protein
MLISCRILLMRGEFYLILIFIGSFILLNRFFFNLKKDKYLCRNLPFGAIGTRLRCVYLKKSKLKLVFKLIGWILFFRKLSKSSLKNIILGYLF